MCIFDVQLLAGESVAAVVFIEADLQSIMMMTFAKAYRRNVEDLNAAGSGCY